MTSTKDRGSDTAWSRWARKLKALGPGLVTGSADNDPSGVATYAQAGAQYTYSMLWTAPVVLPMMIAVQEMCDRTATATGDTLGKLVRRRFNRAGRIIVVVLLLALLVANTVNVAADLMAVGQGMQLLGAGPAQLWAPLGGVALIALLITGSYRIVAKVFIWLCLALLAYVVVMFISGVHWGDVWAGFAFLQLKPDLGYWGLAAAVFGTSISPYLFFWESGQRIEEMRAAPEKGDKAAADPEIPAYKAIRRRKQQRFDVMTGMISSCFMIVAIMVATGSTIGQHHQSISTAADAAMALKPLAGPLAGVIFALGFVGTGLLGVPVLASSACIGLSGLLGKNWGFERSPKKAPVFYGLLVLGLAIGTVLAALLTDAIGLLVLSATINAIAAAPFLIIVMLIASNRRIMGNRRNGVLANSVGWATTAIMAVAGGLAIWAQFAT